MRRPSPLRPFGVRANGIGQDDIGSCSRSRPTTHDHLDPPNAGTTNVDQPFGIRPPVRGVMSNCSVRARPWLIETNHRRGSTRDSRRGCEPFTNSPPPLGGQSPTGFGQRTFRGEARHPERQRAHRPPRPVASHDLEMVGQADEPVQISSALPGSKRACPSRDRVRMQQRALCAGQLQQLTPKPDTPAAIFARSRWRSQVNSVKLTKIPSEEACAPDAGPRRHIDLKHGSAIDTGRTRPIIRALVLTSRAAYPVGRGTTAAGALVVDLPGGQFDLAHARAQSCSAAAERPADAESRSSICRPRKGQLRFDCLLLSTRNGA